MDINFTVLLCESYKVFVVINVILFVLSLKYHGVNMPSASVAYHDLRKLLASSALETLV